jgi:hypothetical protein
VDLGQLEAGINRRVDLHEVALAAQHVEIGAKVGERHEEGERLGVRAEL